MIVQVTPEQARWLADAQAAMAAATLHAQTVLTTLSVGQVPPGAPLTNINLDTGELTFGEPAPNAG